MTDELAKARSAYWNAQNPTEEALALSRMRAAGDYAPKLARKNFGDEADLVMRPFAEAFPPENLRHHFIGQDQAKGIYAKELHIPAGYQLGSHSHQYDHLSILASGTVRFTVGGHSKVITGPMAIEILAGVEHTLFAITKAVWFCIHPTDETDPEKVDDVILGKAD